MCCQITNNLIIGNIESDFIARYDGGLFIITVKTNTKLCLIFNSFTVLSLVRTPYKHNLSI